ncbi:TPA: di-trans,poly-cis-decaprenylcistransferase [Candidatus Dependentiae bacterium]|nr:MAG: Isoprenyl transferase [candidate division TM6 bacterium GW2011_GWE2_31_21]KKP53762.1 MAG: Isoprenyl transferase [candidate division TM6 bacterium GW2011_GWF2_33_332]HBS48484.1 di-trans,poly-cis-decaprenylcistransferase [Candidatus Dependentiae bacterium]HBZ73099.1 di-trans,poly-cis-decaprenylcistransferase [Candidatus Dependentiae bacterium]
MQHLAMIMDGNRRWAKANKLQVFKGHEKGAEAIKTAVNFCLKENIPYLSLYTFSLENFNRSEEEKNYLFSILAKRLRERLPYFIENEVRVRFIGERSFFPQQTLEFINEAETKTANFNKLNLNFLFCYGSRQEILNATQIIAHKVKNNELDPKDITAKMFESNFWMAGVPDPEIIIRTGGENRLSNFLIYQGAYSELMPLDICWPEISENILLQCKERFDSIKRNFGK